MRNHVGSCQKYTFLGPTPDLGSQALLGEGPEACVLSIVMSADV